MNSGIQSSMTGGIQFSPVQSSLKLTMLIRELKASHHTFSSDIKNSLTAANKSHHQYVLKYHPSFLLKEKMLLVLYQHNCYHLTNN